MEEKDYFHRFFWIVMDNLLGFFIGLMVCGVISFCVCKCSLQTPEEQMRDTVTVVTVKKDTFFREKPVPVKEYIIRYARVDCVKDSLKTEHETDDVLSYSGNSNASDEGTPAEPTFTIPITQKEYRDSTYRAWVSGYMATLDSIEVYRRNVFTTQTITVRKKAPRMSVGVVGGYGYGIRSKQLEPFIGVGFSWRL